MKTQISRNSLNLEKRYSGVYQQQGRMLTDADWNESTDLSGHRLEEVAGDVVNNGAPKENGIVDVAEETYTLKWGDVYVDGIKATITPDNSIDTETPAGLIFDYTSQEDFPGAPPLTGGPYKLYLDVWERPVTSNEDQDILDPGLHGADTCTRTQTMAQVKWCSTGINPENKEENPCRGDALLSLKLMNGTEESDLCAPCPVEFDVNKRVGNYLFRVEVHDVLYSAGTPQTVTLKWSNENGAEEYKAGLEPLGYKSGGWVYEFFSGSETSSVSEKQPGLHLNDFTPVRGELHTAWPDIIPPVFSMVRRWDGYVSLEKQPDDSWAPAVTGSAILGCDKGIPLSSLSDVNAPAHITAGNEVTINLNEIFLKIDIYGKKLLAGDYWNVPVRESIHEQGDWVLSESEPIGIEHHYMTIVTTSGGNVSWTSSPWSKEELRQLMFPPLTNLNAVDVGYTIPSCDLLPDGQAAVVDLMDNMADPGDNNPSVKDILDNLLCNLSAATIPVLKDQDFCETLLDGEVTSVQDAINKLCIYEASSCNTVTVHPREDWEDVLSEVEDLDNIHICFRNGSFNLDDTIVFKNKRNIRISGGGRGAHIRCHARESVFRFENCESVAVENVFVECGKVGFEGGLENLNGVLTAINCRNVNFENVVSLCGAGASNAATCLTVRNEEGRDGNAVIKSNELNCGHYQTGILLVNVDRSVVEDNTIHTRPKHGSLSFEDQLAASSKFRDTVRHYLIRDAVIRDFNEDSLLDGSVVPVTVNKRRVEFHSEVDSYSEWKNMVVEYIGDKPVESNKQLLEHVKAAADRMLTRKAFRKKYKEMNEWFQLMKSNNPAIALQGIVVGGQKAGEVTIQNNSLHGVAEAVRVALSDSGKKKYRCGTVRVINNNFHAIVPPFHYMQHQIIFTGHCNHYLYENNHTAVQRSKENYGQGIDGVKVRGILGRMMIIRQNFISNCDVGIRVIPLNEEINKPSQWIVADNMADSARSAVIAMSDAIRNSGNLS